MEKEVIGYCHQDYTGYQKPGNPDFLIVLKNNFNNRSLKELYPARDTVINILLHDITGIMEIENISECLCISVPRAKMMEKYADSQLMFREAVKIASNNILGVTDGTDCIIRSNDTQTTHLKNTRANNNNDPAPYPGITVDTCTIDKHKVKNQNIILIDDIYTKTINIDEDCIQALFDNGAKNIIFYAIGYTI